MTSRDGLTAFDRIRLDKAAVDEGFGLRGGRDGDWLAYDSLAAPASLRLTCDPSGYVVATNHAGVTGELATRWQMWSGSPPQGFVAFVVTDTTPLHHIIREIWRLSRALPIEPLREFEGKARDMPKSTEAERLVVQRVGQEIFRAALMNYWGGSCAVLGVKEPRLLRASHIRPWSHCETDAERLDVYNGLLLSAHLDAAFDAFLVSFEDTGLILVSKALSKLDCIALGITPELRIEKLTLAHRTRLAWHRTQLIATPSQFQSETT